MNRQVQEKRNIRRHIRRHALVSGLALLVVEAGLMATGRYVREFHLVAAAGLWGYYVLLVHAFHKQWLTLQLPAEASWRTARTSKAKRSTADRRAVKRGRSPSPPSFWLAMGTRGYLLFWLAVGVGVAWAGWLLRSQLTGRLQLANSLAFLLGWIALSLLLFAVGRLATRR